MSWQTWKAIGESERAKSRGISGGKIAVDKLNSRHEAVNVENKKNNAGIAQRKDKMKMTFKQIARIAARLGITIPACLLLLAKISGGKL
jgi:hypothetical protein